MKNLAQPTQSGGFIKLPRSLFSTELWELKPAWWTKVWLYILSNANYKDHNSSLRKGELLTTYEQIFTGCHLASEGIKPKSIESVIKHLKQSTQISTRKTTRGFIITVANYDLFQQFSEVKIDTEIYTEIHSQSTQNLHDKERKKEIERSAAIAQIVSLKGEQAKVEGRTLFVNGRKVSSPVAYLAGIPKAQLSVKESVFDDGRSGDGNVYRNTTYERLGVSQ